MSNYNWPDKPNLNHSKEFMPMKMGNLELFNDLNCLGEDIHAISFCHAEWLSISLPEAPVVQCGCTIDGVGHTWSLMDSGKWWSGGCMCCYKIFVVDKTEENIKSELSPGRWQL